MVGYRSLGECGSAGGGAPWLLAAGIAGHGLAWDSWHYLASSTYIPGWYSLGCLLVDAAIGLYAAVRIAGNNGACLR